MTSGVFIAFEGIDGCGKSTTARTTAERIRASGRSCLLTEEPTDGPIGRSIRLILTKQAPMMDPFALQRLFVRDRREHIERIILPALQEGTVVVSDRYWLSTVAYGMLNDPLEKLIALHEEVLGNAFLRPDKTFLLDLDPAVALERMRHSRTTLTHFERIEKLTRIRENYRAIVRAGIETVTMVNAAMSPQGVAETIGRELKPLLR